MKKKFLTVAMIVAFVGVCNADCTVTTDCGVRNYAGNSVSASSSNGVITVSQNGEIIDTFECNGGVSASCSSSSGDGTGGGDNDFNICDFLPDSIKPFFGC
ncbi:hypothetical protein D1816_11965 [Aquimarina sp. AD10]|uniref:hypothetical protein n=1 Tax=Aquimarina sp. AD10 TaxID=1714849 RepID=UPI000E4FEBE3|nr:hypothetical protein [Aquimarina sp. AD10]AXT61032.1 hypothetical protein D1816_11965 [Aquimarina sp. AD10]RKM96330.1 hypothetical protein D7033_15700 [Aquimarina sp. AD10]